MSAGGGRRRGILTVARNDLRRLSRDRVGLFFVALLPFIVIVAIGSFVPDDDVDLVIGVVSQDDSAAADQVVDAIRDAPRVEVRSVGSQREGERDARVNQISGVVVVPDGFGAALEAGRAATVEVFVDPMSSSATLVRSTLGEVLGDESRVRTVQSVLEGEGLTAEQAAVAASSIEGELVRSEVDVRVLGAGEGSDSTFAYIAAGQMLLFMFVNSLAAGAAFADMRRLGVLGRVLAGPVDGGDVLSGLGLARFGVAGTLAVVICTLAAWIYDVDWGSLAVLGAVIVLFGLVSAGASTLIGASFDDPDSVTSVGIPVGLGMAALGGCMFPMFLAPAWMQTVSKILTPHAWAIDAISSASFDGDGLAQVWPDLLVLAAWATVLILLGRSVARRKMRDG